VSASAARGFLQIARRQREDTAEGIAVVAELDLIVALDADHGHAVSGGDFEMFANGAAGSLCPARAGASGETFGEGAERIEHFAIDGFGGCCLEIGGGIADAQGFRPGRIAQETDHGKQFGSVFRFQRLRSNLARANVAGTFPTMVVDLQVVALGATDFQAVTLPQHGMLGSAFPRGGAQTGLILGDDGDDGECGGQHDHCPPSKPSSAARPSGAS
jgi:hypothetical protein